MMEHPWKKYRWLIPVIVLYSVIVGMIVYFQFERIMEYYYEMTGEYASNMAGMAANTLHISDQDVTQLEEMTFSDVLSHPVNKTLEKMFHFEDREEAVKYAYLIRMLPTEKVKYTVEKEDEAFYHQPINTPLNAIWLLDVIVNTQQRVEVDGIKDYYADKNRYTSLTSEVQAIYAKKVADYTLWTDEWGTQIAGFAPVYSDEGNYVGMLGVDLYSGVIFEYQNDILRLMLIVLLVPSVLLSLVYFLLHLRYKKRMSFLAYKDSMTQVYNRRYYDVKGEQYIKEKRKKYQNVHVLIADIDDFKIYNDTYGHQDGDQALQYVAHNLQICMENVDGFIARYGGEEFVCVYTAHDPEGMCQRMLKKLKENVYIHENGEERKLSVSIGVCYGIPEEKDCLHTYMALADEALYEAKISGKNTYRIRNKANKDKR